MRLIGPIAALPLLIVPSAATHTAAPRDRLDERGERAELHPGERWLRVLEDHKAGTLRYVAARELGRLRYVPAIPVLLKYAAQEGASARDRECQFTALADCPCIMALTQFGPEVVAPAARMCIGPNVSDGKREGLEYLLKQESPSRSREATLDEIREFGRNLKNRFEYDRLVELYFRLHKGGEHRSVPSEWPRFEPTPPTGGPDRPLDHVRKRVSSIG